MFCSGSELFTTRASDGTGKNPISCNKLEETREDVLSDACVVSAKKGQFHGNGSDLHLGIRNLVAHFFALQKYK